MSKRQKSASEGNGGSEMEVQDPLPEARMTRSGRRVRTPVALQDSEARTRTPTRRTRKSVLQELPVLEEKNAEEKSESITEEKPSECPKTDPCTETEAPADTCRTDLNVTGTPPTETAPTNVETVPKKQPRLAQSARRNPGIPLGKPKSGRVWKDRNKQRFSALVRDKSLCSSWDKKMNAKRQKELVKQYSLQLKEEKARQKEEKRKRREENLKRRAENERKAEIVQVIKNTTKIKRMKKKQLRKIEKRDTLALLQKSQKQNVKTKVQKSNKIEQDFT